MEQTYAAGKTRRRRPIVRLFGHPRAVLHVCVEAIPLSPVGKPDKKALRARYWGDSARAVN